MGMRLCVSDQRTSYIMLVNICAHLYGTLLTRPENNLSEVSRGFLAMALFSTTLNRIENFIYSIFSYLNSNYDDGVVSESFVLENILKYFLYSNFTG